MEIEEDFNCSECKKDLSYNAAYLTQNGEMVCEKCAAPFLPTVPALNTITAAQTATATVIPEYFLEKLKCSQCLKYLSCGPVNLNQNGSIVCGRCTPLDSSYTRNTQYETLAHLMLFPCKFKKLGCSVSVPFSIVNQETEHEKNCSFRKKNCPIMAPACQWVGLRTEFLEHCRKKHIDRVIENPCNLTYNVDMDSACSFLLMTFDNLFVFHTKICLKTQNIYHAVQYIGEPDENISTKFDFTVDILRNNKMVQRSGQITTLPKFNYDIKTCLTTNLKQLEKALGGLDNCPFTITVNKLSNSKNKCLKCDGDIDQLLYQKNGNWLCKKCIPEKIKCKNKDCVHYDLEKKCKKHESFFCSRNSWCWLCRKNLQQEEISDHYALKHTENSYKEGIAWEANRTQIFEMFLLQASIGNAIIKYRFTESVFELEIRTELSSEQLYQYHCILKLSKACDNQRTKIFVLNTLYNEIYDWKLEVSKADFLKWPESISVVINIDKGPKPQVFDAKNMIYQ